MKPEEEVKDTEKDNAPAKDESKSSETPSEPSGSDKKGEEESNEGVKILQEVFDTKASVSSDDDKSNASSNG